MKYDNVIVFGPSGNVGGAVAQEASRRGTKVWLAMRRIDAPITAISSEEERGGGFQRVEADLNQDLRRITTDDFIAFVHAQVEIKLEDLNISHTALRPGMFASKPFKQDLDTTKTPWEASVLFGEILEDSISPADIGRVGGAVLVDRPSTSSKKAIYLCGPQLSRLDQLWETVRKTLGREIKTVHPSLEEKIAELVQKGFPVPLAKNLVQGMAQRRQTSPFPEPFYSEAVGNIEKYSGRKPTSLADYVASQYKK
ncbi:hypothetical protein LQW54_008247 [Pestalotiopsis sp. IQ-011]